ncbi:hypothetical protein PTTG_27946 [Puccinia triticina 1-1 BBBD Race 1]|uniref:Uncharacterized protein n=1 Tax=Puccinia triticina (isolate 1-1 / race 1 (BBBD)) TaxID=630390 RepID=A0A180GG55_PUCT1|nr:hypothetical protein PTTG_27946 [Puccinia triticina 1-1 BBBD Race 1]WAR63748.1 hypothetical protein PtB15_17B349 [Puccinia triticina]
MGIMSSRSWPNFRKMIEEASPQPSRNQDISEPQSSSLMKKVKDKIRTGPKNYDKLSPSEDTCPEAMESALPSRVQKRVDRFCQAHGFSNPLKTDSPHVPGRSPGDAQDKI